MGPSASSGVSVRATYRRSGWGMVRICLSLGAVALAGAGCGGSSKHQATTGTTTAASTTRTTTPPKPAPLRGIATFTYPSQAAATGAPQNWRVTIYDLRRSGPFVTLDFGAKCLVSGSIGCNGNAFFIDHQLVPAQSGQIRLIDTTNNAEYYPVTDSNDQTYSSKSEGDNASLPPELFWVTFPAPPASAQTMDIAFPNGGPEVPAVPITNAASGPTASQVGGGTVAGPTNKFAKPPNSTDSSGLTFTVRPLVLGVGNPSGSDAEGAGRATISINSDVLFHFDKSNLTPTAQSILGSVAARIKERAKGVVSVTGYTDSIGTDAVNIPLSQARARSVVNFLKPATAGASVTYQSQGLGAQDPVAPNTKKDGSDNPAGRALNRRVTIEFKVRAPAKPAPPAPATPPTSAQASGSLTAQFTANNFGTATYGVTADSIFRVGDMAVLRFNVRCLKVVDNSGLPCDGIENLGGTSTIPPVPGYESTNGLTYRTAAGFYLQDAAGNEYIPAYAQAGGAPVTVQTSQYIGSDPDPLWAYFPAPPASVTSLSVVMPGGSAKIADVPISSTPPPLP